MGGWGSETGKGVNTTGQLVLIPLDAPRRLCRRFF